MDEQVTEERSKVEYEVREKSNIDNKMYEAGERVFYAGLPSENLKPINDEGKARAAEYVESNKQRIREMTGKGDESGVGIKDPTAFAKALNDAQKADNAERDDKIGTAIADGIARGMAQLADLFRQQAVQPAAVQAPATEDKADKASPAKQHK